MMLFHLILKLIGRKGGEANKYFIQSEAHSLNNDCAFSLWFFLCPFG
jgi:hypothetical protein